MNDCVLCKIAAGEIPCHKVYEDDQHIAFMDMGQVNPGHVIVSIKPHCETIVEIHGRWCQSDLAGKNPPGRRVGQAGR